jgi:MarR family transcriptional regulator, organic hydroperoxide resistance regulator
LRVWGEMDARTLAAEAGVTAATLTGVMKTLEARQLLRRKTDRADGRRVLVALTAAGRRVVDEIMPAFNRHERLVTQALSEEEQIELAHILRTILRTVEAIDL